MRSKTKATNQRAFGEVVDIGILVISISFLCFLSLKGILSGYSLWQDELFTVAFIKGSWHSLINEWVLPDVHPPLYFAVSKLWAQNFGISEISLRSLSLIFAIGTILLAWANWRFTKRGSALILLCLTACNPYFIYYAQEARSYALLIFSCYCLTLYKLYFVKNRSRKGATRKIILAAIYLTTSLIHFFGYLYSITMILIDIIEEGKIDLKFNTSCLGIITAWPLFHIGILGNLGATQKEQIKLAMQPAWVPLQAFSITNLPFINSGKISIDMFTAAGLITIVSVYIIRHFRPNYSDLKQEKNELTEKHYFVYCTKIIVLFLAVVTLLNLYSPISTYRNFTVLLPATTIALSIAINDGLGWIRNLKKHSHGYTIASRLIGSIFLCVLILVSSKIAIVNTQIKSSNRNFTVLAEYLKKASLCKTDYCYTTDYDPESIEWGATILDYYFQNYKLKGLDFRKVLSDNQEINLENRMVIGSAIQLSDSEIKLLASKIGYHINTRLCLPKESNNEMPFVLTRHESNNDINCKNS